MQRWHWPLDYPTIEFFTFTIQAFSRHLIKSQYKGHIISTKIDMVQIWVIMIYVELLPLFSCVFFLTCFRLVKKKWTLYWYQNDKIFYAWNTLNIWSSLLTKQNNCILSQTACKSNNCSKIYWIVPTFQTY